MYNLLPYRSTTSSEPRLAPEGVTAKLDESLHRAPPPICATTEYHRMMQTLSSYVAPTPDAGSILSAHNTPFDPHEPTGFVVRSRADKQASFVTGGEQIYILEATELFDECERWLLSLKIQDTYTQLRKGRWTSATNCDRDTRDYNELRAKDMWRYSRRVRRPTKSEWGVRRWGRSSTDSRYEEPSAKSKVLDQVEVQLLISEGKEDAKYPSTKEKAIDRDGQLETVHQYLVSGLRPPDCEVGGRSSGSNEVAWQHLAQGLRPPDEVREIKCAHAQGVEAVKIGVGQVDEAKVPIILRTSRSQEHICVQG
ncbi:hypothetical protein BKA82DRAFT_4017388 [Pisolithus tinctorius]|nr:hypothetical protein BKA82DRAFT_4017388 [Pisolithus tinctorius]